MYQVGEHIMYRNIGICIIEAVGKLGFSSEKSKDYYTLRPLHANTNSRFYIPVNTDVFMRSAMTRQEACQYLTELKNMHTKPFCGKKQAQLVAHYDSLLSDHNLLDHLKLFKELYQKEEKIRESGKKFGQLESNYKKQIEKLLTDEFSYALNESPELSKKRLYSAAAA